MWLRQDPTVANHAWIFATVGSPASASSLTHSIFSDWNRAEMAGKGLDFPHWAIHPAGIDTDLFSPAPVPPAGPGRAWPGRAGERWRSSVLVYNKHWGQGLEVAPLLPSHSLWILSLPPTLSTGSLPSGHPYPLKIHFSSFVYLQPPHTQAWCFGIPLILIV